jgi:hypothetical protein
MQNVLSLATLDALREHVLQVLCAHHHLEPAQTPLLQSLIQRRGKPCGLFFQAQGPRLLRTYAVWAAEERRVLFYDNHGERFAETRLEEGPDVRRLEA